MPSSKQHSPPRTSNKTQTNVAKHAPLERDKAWAASAINAELNKLSYINSNINKPSSQFFICILKICSVLKGSGKSHFPPSSILSQVEKETGNKSGYVPNEKDIRRQWSRAYRMAKPRYRGAGQ